MKHNYRKLRPTGGSLTHLVRKNDVALCGFKPSSPNGVVIRNRSCWWDSSVECSCKKCNLVLERQQACQTKQ